jgi:hypothetical protein
LREAAADLGEAKDNEGDDRGANQKGEQTVDAAQLEQSRGKAEDARANGAVDGDRDQVPPADAANEFGRTGFGYCGCHAAKVSAAPRKCKLRPNKPTQNFDPKHRPKKSKKSINSDRLLSNCSMYWVGFLGRSLGSKFWVAVYLVCSAIRFNDLSASRW